ncbi:amylo-alpha-1,6-glucosidase [Photobacterium sagamiensis]|uniref:alpha-L-rhamnosidase-related protein n=1 Tax=Photobacterium sagamiensis TaxID=2910241 RepID=UPI003D0E378A
MKPTLLAVTVALVFSVAGCNSSDTSSDTAMGNSGNTDNGGKDIPIINEDTPVIEEALYLRGINGDWGASDRAKLIYQGKSQYISVIRVARGTNQFKVADEGWQIEYTGYRTPIVFGQQNEFVAKPAENTDCMNQDCNSEITFPDKGYYKFAVDLSDIKRLQLTVTEATQEEAEQFYQDAIIDPSTVHIGHKQSTSSLYRNYDNTTDTVKVSVKDPDASIRTFGISTTAELRDALDQGLYVSEDSDKPRVRTGDLAFDGLFALSVQELNQLAVSEIKDGNYNHNKPIKADVFETGAKWHYVWTRDLAYAADLSVALLDPERVRNGLEFKLSDFREGTGREYDGEQIIQDTGTGGSWPISTDRTSWALGAERLLSTLTGEEYDAFAKRAYHALSNTIEADQVAAFDKTDGLYQGEQSFLDWRDQTYSSWTPDNVNYIATSKALSTNIVHYRALMLAAKLAESYDTSAVTEYQQWANELKQAINAQFWNSTKGLYSSYRFDAKTNIQVDKYDMLGEALAIISGIADDDQAKKIMANYPHSEFGAPVYFPQQPGVAVYHNRAIWPFVTAYSLKAAAKAENVAAANNAYQSLLRGTALNLSNMENLEWLSGQSLILHGDHGKDSSLDGPVINSQRQLWSVGGYLGMVVENIFGFNTDNGVLTIKPFITAELRNTTFKNSSQIKIENLLYKGAKYSVTVELPPVDDNNNGYFEVASVNKTNNDIVVTLGQRLAGDDALTLIEGVLPYDTDNAKAFSPQEPALDVTNTDGDISIVVENQNNYAVNIYRNSQQFQTNDSGSTFTDKLNGNEYVCYVAETINSAGYRSNPSKPVCTGEALQVQFNGTYSLLNKEINIVPFDGINKELDGKKAFQVAETGTYDFAALYNNNLGQLNTGITNSVKKLTVKDGDGKVVADGILQMGHIGEAQGLRMSTPVNVQLSQGIDYSFTLSDHFNMSYLNSNNTYIYSGGLTGFENSTNLVDMKITRH